ncbi:putative taxadien-5-alpha-ol O-acetyltransferase [Medicago truncatula]|uniref:Putative taxadien-5-alpha-ol O-acetyltransferase n=2 Tax=Medicago truncatula TaxID=3880 RepID=A0A396ITJ2_MEDTR|nr:putative taxadien-5-alpha-ol O-acetyltransferase [Medicago truncatula]
MTYLHCMFIIYMHFFSHVFAHPYSLFAKDISNQYLTSHYISHRSFSMEYEKAPLNIEKEDVLLVKPSKSTSSCILSLSTLDNKGANNNIAQTVHVYRSSSIHDYDSSFNPCHVFKEALSKALFYYYPLAGRLVRHTDGKFRVKINTDSVEFGVPFLEATANCTLSSLHYLDNTNTEIAKHLVLDLPSPQDKNYPLVLMVTKFLCGGFTIGMGMSHAICDGFGASQFFKAILELARGRTEPSVKPVWERENQVGTITTQPFPQCPMDRESVAFSPFVNQPNTKIIKQYCFKVEGETITRLKLSLMNENIRFTTFEVLAGYVWRSRARALKLSSNDKTMLNVLVGIRRNLMDYETLPKGYYGNSTIDAKVVLKVSELDEMPLYKIVKLIKETKNIAFTADYVRNSINSLETNQEDGLSMELEASGAVTVLTEWKHLGFQENLDFGGYELVNFLPAPCKMLATVDACIFSSANKLDDHDPSMDGGVRIFTSLPVAAMPKFKDEIEALRFLYRN